MNNQTRHEAIVSMGSNIDPEENLKTALQQLDEYVTVLAISPVYETKPVGIQDQPDFLNAAVHIQTEQDPLSLRTSTLKQIEEEMGRDRSGPKPGPRKIDLDITLFNQTILRKEELHLPDPDLLRHPHVAIPIARLVPSWVHPETGQTMRQIANSLSGETVTPLPDVQLIQD